MDNEKIKNLIHQEIQSDKRLSQFNYDKIPAHEHNGVDTVKISQANIINNSKYQLQILAGYPILPSAQTQVNFTISNLPNVTQMTFNGIAANEGVGGTVNMTYSNLVGTLHNGDVVTVGGNTFTIVSFTGTNINATVTTGNNLPLPTGNFTTNASASGKITVILSTKVASITGNVQFGNCFTVPILTGTNITFANQPKSFVQSSTNLYTDTTSLANTVSLVSIDSFAEVDDNTFTTVAQIKVLSYTNKVITIQVNLAVGWAIIGNLILI